MAKIIYETPEGDTTEEEVESVNYHEDRESWYWTVGRDEEEKKETRKYVPRERVYTVLEERSTSVTF